MTNTPRPTATSTVTDTPTITTTHTPSPSDTPSPTDTATVTQTATDTITPTHTATPTSTDTDVPTETSTSTLTDTPLPSDTPTEAPTGTPMPTITATPSPEAAVIVEPSPVLPTPTLEPETVPPDGGGRFPFEAAIGGLLLAAILGYVALYLRGVAIADRYAKEFMLETCPVCGRGELLVEVRQERWFGIPRARRIVRCTECRSVLRETGDHRWRYAIDPLENPALYRRYNGQEIDDETLMTLATNPPEDTPDEPQPPVTPPSFIDDEDE
ncbi:MAG: hypothetical protein K8L99_25415 [Anaerolineae bacterium]|nr:hypothetical protein [Anaerolineae bacterium]